MEQEVFNFARFYAAFNRLPYEGDREEFKKSIVSQYTWNRTDSLRGMTRQEYRTCCAALERLSGLDEARHEMQKELRFQRSAALKLMQKLGIDTTDWTRINAFCKDPRIAGVPFAFLDVEKLKALIVKLRVISRKGGLNAGENNRNARPVERAFMLLNPDAMKC